jgi:hypothetical protein
LVPKPSIFVSHASEDAAIAGAIKDYLEGLFLDLTSSSRLEQGFGDLSSRVGELESLVGKPGL